jgi:hypothetical protein
MTTIAAINVRVSEASLMRSHGWALTTGAVLAAGASGGIKFSSPDRPTKRSRPGLSNVTKDASRVSRLQSTSPAAPLRNQGSEW